MDDEDFEFLADIEDDALQKEAKRQALLMMRAYYAGPESLRDWIEETKENPGVVMQGVMLELDFFLGYVGKQMGWTPPEHVEALIKVLEDGE